MAIIISVTGLDQRPFRAFNNPGQSLQDARCKEIQECKNAQNQVRLERILCGINRFKLITLPDYIFVAHR